VEAPAAAAATTAAVAEDGAGDAPGSEVHVAVDPLETELVESIPSGKNANELVRGTREQIGEAYVFFVALSVHAVFDGIGLGSETTVGGFYALLITVCGHKVLDGFSLGIPLFLANFPLRHNIFACLFCALMTPIGIAIGLSVTAGLNGAAGQLAQAILLSLSAGSFLFISLIELLPAALRDGQYIRGKLGMCVFGWGIMALIALWA